MYHCNILSVQFRGIRDIHIAVPVSRTLLILQTWNFIPMWHGLPPPRCPQPLAASTLLSVSIILGTTWQWSQVFILPWLVYSCSTVFSGFVHIIARVRISFLPKTEYCSTACKEHFVYPFVCRGHLGSSHLQAIVNNASMNTGAQVSPQVLLRLL